jgi:molecular chaperone GrpE
MEKAQESKHKNESKDCCKDNQREMQDLLSKAEEMENNWKRALADYKNLEKRVVEEKQEFAKYSLSTFVGELLTIIDNLEKAQEHLKDTGVSLVLDGFKALLKKEGVLEIESYEKDFDPLLHDAIEMGEGAEGKIIKVLEKGYKIGNRILRPAKVVVGKSFESKESVEDSQTSSNK